MDGEKQIQKAYESILDQDFERAIEWFSQAVALEPDNADYHYKLSITYARSNKLAKAIEHARTAVRLEPQSDVYRFHWRNIQARELVQQAELYFHQEREQLHTAIQLCREAIALDPLNCEAYLLLGMAHAGTGNCDAALDAVREAVKLNPDHGIAKRLYTEYSHNLKQYE